MVEKYKITKQEEVYNLLKDKRNFSYMSESLLRRLISEMKVVRFTKKTLLLKQDTENRFIYIIIKGMVTVYVDKKPLYTLRRTGDVFGELSFATKSPSTASIVAEEGLGVMAISFSYLKKLNDIEFGLWLCHVLGEKLVRTSKLKSIRTAENMDELEPETPTAINSPETGGESLEPAEMPDGESAADTVSAVDTDSDGEDNGEAVTGEDNGETATEETWETPPDIEEIPLG
ncbi:cyclic nucleotide-binding domain-containing protein [bacterium]|nr:cyclic nucleotide-binding domain-containing protein [bacterium]